MPLVQLISRLFNASDTKTPTESTTFSDLLDIEEEEVEYDSDVESNI